MMSYVLAAITYFNTPDAKEVVLKARGMSITLSRGTFPFFIPSIILLAMLYDLEPTVQGRSRGFSANNHSPLLKKWGFCLIKGASAGISGKKGKEGFSKLYKGK